MSSVFFLLVIVFSAIIHEYSHGWMANQLGDPTAKYAGRLTLNPIKHIDLFGSIILPLVLILSHIPFLFAYAKPVPYNPFNLKDQKWGPTKVAFAGPFSNFLLAFIFGVISWFLPVANATKELIKDYVLYGQSFAQVAGGDPWAMFYGFIVIIIFANVLLGVFNLVPIPPLDGSKVLFALLPAHAVQLRQILHQYGFVILIVFIFAFSHVLIPVIQFFVNLFVGSGPLF